MGVEIVNLGELSRAQLLEIVRDQQNTIRKLLASRSSLGLTPLERQHVETHPHEYIKELQKDGTLLISSRLCRLVGRKKLGNLSTHLETSPLRGEIHFAARLLERFNIRFDRLVRREILLLIKTKGIRLKDSLKNNYRFIIPYAGAYATVVLSTEGSLTTVFKTGPAEMFAAGIWKPRKEE